MTSIRSGGQGVCEARYTKNPGNRDSNELWAQSYKTIRRLFRRLTLLI
jgi:hypothetical protein